MPTALLGSGLGAQHTHSVLLEISGKSHVWLKRWKVRQALLLPRVSTDCGRPSEDCLSSSYPLGALCFNQKHFPANSIGVFTDWRIRNDLAVSLTRWPRGFLSSAWQVADRQRQAGLLGGAGRLIFGWPIGRS